jgi:cytochrome c oxidase cbb3-type subunit III
MSAPALAGKHGIPPVKTSTAAPSGVRNAHEGTPERDNSTVTSPQSAHVLDHSYDGICEYDNPLPGWWSALFWLTIVFSAGYWVVFHVAGWIATPDAKYQAALADYEDNRETRAAAEARDVNEPMLARNAQDPNVIAAGAKLFATRCASCHADNGRGLIGPNLTDSFQLHGETRMDLLKTVRGGVPGTAMLAWGEQMSATDVVTVASFVASLRGTNVKGKEPQGHPVGAFQ